MTDYSVPRCHNCTFPKWQCMCGEQNPLPEGVQVPPASTEWTEEMLTPEFVAQHGNVIVRVLLGPNQRSPNWWWASQCQPDPPWEEQIFSGMLSGVFGSGRWPLSTAMEMRRKSPNTPPERQVKYVVAARIKLDSCPLCGCHAVWGQLEHGERWGSWKKTIHCSSGHCRCNVSLNEGREDLEERLASMWNRRYDRWSTYTKIADELAEYADDGISAAADEVRDMKRNASAATYRDD